jgi:hypothetical protein
MGEVRLDDDKFGLSHDYGGEIIPVVEKLGYVRSEFGGYLGSVG